MELFSSWSLWAATGIALVGAIVSILFTARGTGRHHGVSTSVVVPFGGGILLGIAVFGLLPELADDLGWLRSLLLFAAGYLGLMAAERGGLKVCPTCAPEHGHGHCKTELHGFAWPLVAVAALHAFLDGWGLAMVRSGAHADVRVALPLAVILHKIPEGVGLGSLLRAATVSRGAAIGLALLAELPTLLGGAIGTQVAPSLGSAWMTMPLAVAGGCFAFLGYHAIHGEWKLRGVRRAGLAALTGIAGAGVLQQGVRAILR